MPKKINSKIPKNIRIMTDANDQHGIDLWCFQNICDPRNKLTRDQKKFYADCMVEEYNNKQKEYSSNYIMGTEQNLLLGQIHGHNYYSNEEVHPGPRVDRDQQTLPGVDWSVVDWSVYDN